MTRKRRCPKKCASTRRRSKGLRSRKTRKQRGGDIDPEITSITLKLLECSKTLNTEIFTLSNLVDGCGKSVLDLIKLDKFISSNKDTFKGIREVEMFQEEIQKYIKTITTRLPAPQRGGVSLKMIIFLALSAIAQVASGESVQVSNAVALRGRNMNGTQYSLTSTPAVTSRGLGFNTPSNAKLSESLVKLIDKGAQANISLYQTYVVKKFKNPVIPSNKNISAEQEKINNYKAERDIIQAVSSVKGLKIPVVKYLASNDETYEITYQRFLNDAESLVDEPYKLNPRTGKMNVNGFAPFDPIKVTQTQSDNFVKGIADLHKHGIAHRDIHNGNIFVNIFGEFGLLDFTHAVFDPRKFPSPQIPAQVADAVSQFKTLGQLEEYTSGRGYNKFLVRTSGEERINIETFIKMLSDFFSGIGIDNEKVMAATAKTSDKGFVTNTLMNYWK